MSEIVRNAGFIHPVAMGRPRKAEIEDKWPQRWRFLELLDAKLASGASYQDIAEALELQSTRSLEHEYRYDRSRRPSRRTIELAAPYFGVDQSEIDGPAPEPDGLSMDDRAELRAMGTDLKKLSPDQRSAAVRIWRATIDGFMKSGATIETKVIRKPKG